MNKKLYIIIAVVLVLAVAGLVVYAQMNGYQTADAYGPQSASEIIPEEPANVIEEADAAEKQAAVDPDFKYVEPDARFFKTLCYKEDIFPSECRYELITLENGDAIMLDVILDENKIQAVKAVPIVIVNMKVSLVPKRRTVTEYYRFLKDKNVKTYLYRLSYLNNSTGEERDIAYFVGAILGKPAEYRYSDPEKAEKEKDYTVQNGWFDKLMIYDAFVKDDLSELKLLAGQNYDVDVMVFKLGDILRESDRQEYFDIERTKHYYRSFVAGGYGISEFRFLTPSVVSITKRTKDLNLDVTHKYHLMPAIMSLKPNQEECLYLKIKWFNEACDFYTFNSIMEIYGFRDPRAWQRCPSDEEIASYRQKHGFTDSSEPAYDMNEWAGWTRMNRDTAWLKD